jgi:hypothetical protein
MSGMFKDAIECYHAIGNTLANAAKGSSWDRIVVDATLDGMRVDAVVACWLEDQARPVRYLTGVPRLALFMHELARLVSTEEKGLFKKCQFVLEKDGKFNADFVY